MAWAALGKGLMGTARAVGGGARMAKSIFKRKGGKNAPEKPASEQTVDVEAQEVKVRPSTSLIPTAPAAAIVNDTSASSGDDVEEVAIRIKTNLISVEKLLSNSYAYREKVREDEKKQLEDAKRAKAEDESEKPKKKKSKFELPGKKQVTSFFDLSLIHI